MNESGNNRLSHFDKEGNNDNEQGNQNGNNSNNKTTVNKTNMLDGNELISPLQTNGVSTNGNSDLMAPPKTKWDPKNLEIRTHSVEKTLEPLVMQVSCNQV